METRTLIFYEAPHRISESIEDMAGILGGRKAAVVKEITKVHEEVLRGSLTDLVRMLPETIIAGEYVIVVEGRQRQEASFEDALDEVRVLMKKGRGRKEAVKIISEQYGLSKNDLYERSLVDI